MNKMAFKNYLKKYIQSVSTKKTMSIHSLIKESKKNVRLIDPLILYCVFNNKTDVLEKYTGEYKHLYGKIEKCNCDFSEFKEFTFSKIYDSYLHNINRCLYDLKIKNEMRKNIISLKKKKHISNYRIYKDLNLNPGNVNSFLKNNNLDKLSLSTTKKIVNYLYNC